MTPVCVGCPPCPGASHEAIGHCAECCFGQLVEADLDCPVHGLPAFAKAETYACWSCGSATIFCDGHCCAGCDHGPHEAPAKADEASS